MEKKSHIALSLSLGVEHFDAAVGLLSLEGFENFWEDGDTLHAYILEREWTAEKKANVLDRLKNLVGTSIPAREEKIDDRNWNADWEATLAPIDVSDRVAIVQHGKSYDNRAGKLLIEINPKMSFGTGYHETTRLMIQHLETVMRPNDMILDIGTGTGVLAIAARKLGNTLPILAFDNDEWSVENAQENIATNHCADITVKLLDAESDLTAELRRAPFTLILANVNRNVVEKILPIVHEHAPKASVLLSGILKYDEAWLRHLTSNLTYRIESLTAENEWLCAFIKKSNRSNDDGNLNR